MSVKIKMVFMNAIRSLDRWPEKIPPRYRPVALPVLRLAVVGVVALVVWGITKALWRGTKALWRALGGTGAAAGDEEETGNVAYERAKFLARESARLVAQALEKRTSNVLEAYEHATQAAVLARTAKELDDDPERSLGDDLGVNFLEYLSYTATVLQDVRSRLVSGYGR